MVIYNVGFMKKSRIVIGCVGYKESGKSFAASTLINTYGFKKVAFADHLKFVLKESFAVIMIKKGDDSYHPINEFYTYKNIAKNVMLLSSHLCSVLRSMMFSRPLNIGTVLVGRLSTLLLNYYEATEFEDLNNCARKIVQFFGTEICRSNDDNIWVNHTDDTVGKYIEDSSKLIVIDDVRFQNEFDYIKSGIPKKYKVESILIGIQPVKPESYLNDRFKTMGICNHGSETCIPDLLKQCDFIIENDYTDGFNLKVLNLISDIIGK